jgi:hypothetical protein
MCQFLIYGPAHGTPAHERMKAEGRFRSEVMGDHRKQDGFYLGFKHPHIDADEMLSIQRNLYRQEFERMGPSVFRVVEDWLTGFVNLHGHPAERVRAKAQRYKYNSHRAMMLLPASQRYLNPLSADRLERLHQRLAAETGPMTQKEHMVSRLVPAMLRYTSFKLRHNIRQQPRFSRRTFRMGKRARHLAANMLLPQPLDLERNP